jgi:hypothetical protein
MCGGNLNTVCPYPWSKRYCLDLSLGFGSASCSYKAKAESQGRYELTLGHDWVFRLRVKSFSRDGAAIYPWSFKLHVLSEISRKAETIFMKSDVKLCSSRLLQTPSYCSPRVGNANVTNSQVCEAGG